MNWEKGGSYNPLDAENLSQDHDRHHQSSEGCIPTPHEYHNYPQGPHQTSTPLPDTFEGLGAPPPPVDTHFSSTGASSTQQQQLEEGSHSIQPYHHQQHNSSSENHYYNRHHRLDGQIASNIDSYNDNQHNTSSGGTCASITRSSSSRNRYSSPRKGVGQNTDVFGGVNPISSSSPATIALNEKRQYHHHVSKEVRRGRPAAQQEHSRQNTSTHRNSAMHVFPRHNYDQSNSTHTDAYIGVTHHALHNSQDSHYAPPAFVRSNAGVTTPVHPHHQNRGVPRIDPHSNTQHAHAYAVASSHPANFYYPYISAQHPATAGAHGVSRDDNPIETKPQHLFSNQHLNNMEENSTTVARPPHPPHKSIILTHPKQQKNNSRWNFLLMTRILLRTLKLQEAQQQREYQSKDQDKEQYFHQRQQHYEHENQEHMRQQLDETHRLYHQAKSIIQDCCLVSFDDRTILTAKNTTTSTEIATTATSSTANTGTTTSIHGTNDGDRPEQPFSLFNGDAMTDSGDGRTNNGIKPNIICSSNINFNDTRVGDRWTTPIRTTKPGDYEQQNTQQRHDETHAPSMTSLPSWANAIYKRLREVEGIIPYLDNAEKSVERYWERKKARNDAAAVPEKSVYENHPRNIGNSSGIMSPLSFTSSSKCEEEEDIRISPIRVRTASPPP